MSCDICIGQQDNVPVNRFPSSVTTEFMMILRLKVGFDLLCQSALVIAGSISDSPRRLLVMERPAALLMFLLFFSKLSV
jgi:hypothetical protein